MKCILRKNIKISKMYFLPLDSSAVPGMPTLGDNVPLVPNPVMFPPYFPSPSMVPGAPYMWSKQLLATYGLENGMMSPYKYPDAKTLAALSVLNSQTVASAIVNHAPQNVQIPKKYDTSMKKKLYAGNDMNTRSKHPSMIIGGGNATDIDPSQLLECPHCGKLCRKPCDLKRHLMMHTGEKPFKCNVSSTYEKCNKKYTDDTWFTIHLQW